MTGLQGKQIIGLAPSIHTVGEYLFRSFQDDPYFVDIPNWRQIPMYMTHPSTALRNTVVNYSLWLDILPILQTRYTAQVLASPAGIQAAMIWFIQNYLFPYWMQSEGSGLVGRDPRGVNVVWTIVPDATTIGQAMTYVFNYNTPPGTPPAAKSVTSAQHNVTLAGNSTRVATKLKLSNSTVHLDANLTKRDTFTCSGFYPNLLPFLRGGPITQPGTETLSCAS